MTVYPPFIRFFAIALALCLSASVMFGKTAKKRTPTKKAAVTAKKAKSTGVRSRSVAVKKAPVKTTRVKAKKSTRSKYRLRASRRSSNRFVSGGPWLEPTFADSTIGDNVDGEDLAVRRAAVDALGPYNGSVVVADPQTGRVLTIVNQKVAFGGGF